MRCLSMLLLLVCVSCSEERSACERACHAACSKAVECLGGQGSCGAQCSDACEDGPHVVFGVDVNECVAALESLTCDEVKSASVPTPSVCEGLLPAGSTGGFDESHPQVAPVHPGGFTYDWTDPQVTLRSLATLMCDERATCGAFEIRCKENEEGTSCAASSWDADCRAALELELFDENCFNLSEKDVEFLSSCVLSLKDPSCPIDQRTVEFFALDLAQFGLAHFRHFRSIFADAPPACEALLQNDTNCSWLHRLPRLGLTVECSACR